MTVISFLIVESVVGGVALGSISVVENVFQTVEIRQPFQSLRVVGDDISQTGGGGDPSTTISADLSTSEIVSIVGTQDIFKTCSSRLVVLVDWQNIGQPDTIIGLSSQGQFLNIPFDIVSRANEALLAENFIVQLRANCDPIVSGTGQELDYRIRGGDTISIKFTSTDINSQIKTVATKTIPVGTINFQRESGDDPLKIQEGCTDNCGIFVGNERILGTAIIPASSLDNAVKTTSSFITRSTIALQSGSILVEIPFISNAIGSTYQNEVNLNKDALTTSFSTKFIPAGQISIPIVTDDTLNIQIVDINPRVIVKDNESASDISLLTVKAQLNQFETDEPSPRCFVKNVSTGATVAGQTMTTDSSTGLSTVFKCTLRIPNSTPTGTYKVEVSSTATENFLQKRGSASDTVEIKLDVTAKGSGEDDPLTCPEGSKVIEDVNGLNNEDLLQTKSNLEKKRQDNTINQCEIERLAVVNSEIAERGLGSEELPEPKEEQKLQCKQGESQVKTSSGVPACVPTGFTNLFPEFKVCAPDETTDLNASPPRICVPPILFSLFSNPIQILFIGVGLMVVIGIVKIGAWALGGQKGGIKSSL